VPANAVEVSVVEAVLPVVAPEVAMVNGLGVGVDRLNDGAATVAATVVAAEVEMAAPNVVPVPVMFRVRPPLVPRVVVRETLAVAVPPAVSVAGVTVQVPAAVPLVLVAVQVKLTVPANRFGELRATVLVPEVEPAATLIAAPPVAVKEAAVNVVVTTGVGVVAVTVPEVPPIARLNVPLVPGVEVTVTVEVAVPLATRVTGVATQEPAAVPEALVATQVRMTAPTRLLVEVTVMGTVFAVVWPEIRLIDAVAGVSVKPGVVSVATIGAAIEAVAAMVPPVGAPLPLTARERTPAVPAVEVSVTVEVAVPLAVRVAGVAVQEPAAVPLVLVATQLTVTVPAKPLTEVRVTTLVLPVVAPEVRLSVSGKAAIVNEDAVRLTVMAEDVTTVVPLVPVTVTLRTPEVPGVVVMVSVLVPVPPEVSVTEPGDMAQVPAAVPPTLVTVQVDVTPPAKLLSDAKVTTSVLPVVTPEIRL
jgi:hypothetical protein